MLAEGSLLPDDWVSEGLGFIPLATWLERIGDEATGPHAHVLNLPRPDEKLSSAEMVPSPRRKSIPLSHRSIVAEPLAQRVFTRRRVLLGASACLATAAVAVTVNTLTNSDTRVSGGFFSGGGFSLEELRRSIVRIIVKSAPAGMGTGFCIDAARAIAHGSVIATASHVVDAGRLNSLVDSRKQAVIQTHDGDEWELKAPFAWDKQLDHCAFHTQRQLPALKLAEKLPLVGTRIYALGFAEGEAFAAVEGKVLSYSLESLRIMTSARVVGGFSGGPVINENGEVIGMTVTRKYGENSSSGSVPLHELQNLRQRMEFIDMAAE